MNIRMINVALLLGIALLTGNVERLAVPRSALEGRGASARLTSGLRLLDTVLPVEEAVIFRLDESGAAVQAARLRSAAAQANGHADADRNNAWRESVTRCAVVTSIGDASGNPKCVNTRWRRRGARNVSGSFKLEYSWLFSRSLTNKYSSAGNVPSKSAATNFHKYDSWMSKRMRRTRSRRSGSSASHSASPPCMVNPRVSSA